MRVTLPCHNNYGHVAHWIISSTRRAKQHSSEFFGGVQSRHCGRSISLLQFCLQSNNSLGRLKCATTTKPLGTFVVQIAGGPRQRGTFTFCRMPTEGLSETRSGYRKKMDPT